MENWQKCIQTEVQRMEMIVQVIFWVYYLLKFKNYVFFLYLIENRGEFLEKLQRARSAVRQFQEFIHLTNLNRQVSILLSFKKYKFADLSYLVSVRLTRVYQ